MRRTRSPKTALSISVRLLWKRRCRPVGLPERRLQQGAEAQVAQLAKAEIPRIAFVSCNPVTFARDAARLTEAGYALDWVQVVDQFRWSSHVELVAQFRLSKS